MVRWSIKTALKCLMYAAILIIFVTSLCVVLRLGDSWIYCQCLSLKLADPLHKARTLCDEQRYCEALDNLNYWMDYDDVKNDPAAQELYKKIRDARYDPWYWGKQILYYGVWKGRGDCLEALAAAAFTDFFLVGALRDLFWEANKIFAGEDRDDFVIALATTQIALTAIPPALAVKGAVATLNVAKKMKRIPPELQKSLIQTFHACKEARSWKPLEPVAEAMTRLSKIKGVKAQDVFAILPRCQNIKDLQVMADAASKLGRNTGKFFALGETTTVAVVRKFGKQENLAVALNSAIRHGENGTRLLERTGPDKFLKYLNQSKYVLGGVRSWHQGRLSELGKKLTKNFRWWLLHLVSLLPTYLQYLMLAISGTIVVGGPTVSLWKWRRSHRLGDLVLSIALYGIAALLATGLILVSSF